MPSKRKATAAATEASKKARGGVAVGDVVADAILNVELATNETVNNAEHQTSLKALLDGSTNGVIVFFYPKANTPGCTKQACGFRDEHSKIEAAGYTVVGMSADKPKSQNNWREKNDLPYNLLCDVNYEVMGGLGVSADGKKISRSHIVLDKTGKVVQVHIGVRPANSVEEVIEAIGAKKDDEEAPEEGKEPVAEESPAAEAELDADAKPADATEEAAAEAAGTTEEAMAEATGTTEEAVAETEKPADATEAAEEKQADAEKPEEAVAEAADAAADMDTDKPADDKADATETKEETPAVEEAAAAAGATEAVPEAAEPEEAAAAVPEAATVADNAMAVDNNKEDDDAGNDENAVGTGNASKAATDVLKPSAADAVSAPEATETAAPDATVTAE